MTQKTDKIAAILQDLETTNISDTDKFQELLKDVCAKIVTENSNEKTLELLKEYLGILAKNEYEKYSISCSKFRNIEESLKLIIRGSYDHTQSQDTILTFNECLKVFGTEEEIKELLQSIELLIVKLDITNSSSKEEIVYTIKNQLLEILSLTKDAISTVAISLRQIMSNFDLYVVKKMSDKSAQKVDLIIKDLQIINNYMNSTIRRNSLLMNLLNEIVSNENLKTSEGFSNVIVDKINEIANKLSITNTYEDNNTLKDNVIKISEFSEALSEQIDSVKDILAKVSQDTSEIKPLEMSLAELYNKADFLCKCIDNVSSKQEINNLNSKIGSYISEIEMIKNIIEDLKDVTYTKVISTINDISFENESYDIKNHVSKMLTQLPQKEDIEKILIDGEYANAGIDEIKERAKVIDEKIEYLAGKEDVDILIKGQESLSEKLTEIADKEDVENIGQETHEIKQMIGSINFDDEFRNLYDKTSNIEEWFINSQLKENTNEILKTLETKAEESDVQKVLDVVKEIMEQVTNLVKNPDSALIKRIMEASYNKIEALKVEFLNSTEFHNGNILLKLDELQNAICSVTTGAEFAEFVEHLKAVTTQILSDNRSLAKGIEENKEIQKEILNSIDKLDFSGAVNNLNNNFESFAGDVQRTVESSNNEVFQKVIDVENKLTSLSEFLKQINLETPEEVREKVEDIKEEQEEDFNQLQEIRSEQIEEIRNYLESIQELFESTQFGLTPEIEEKIISVEDVVKEYKEIGKNNFNEVMERLDECINIVSDETITNNIETSINEIKSVKEQLVELGESFAAIKIENNQKSNNITDFVSKKLFELSENLEDMTYEIKDGFQQGFAYSAELIEEKNAALLEFIKELRHSNTDNMEIYERLTVTDNKLMDIKQELQLVNSDIINNMSSKTEVLLKELSPIRQLVSDFSNQFLSERNNVKLIDSLEALHGEVTSELKRSADSSRSTFQKIDELYEDLFSHLSNMEKRLRDFIGRDLESFLLRVDSLKDSMESLNDVVIPIADQMREFHEFAQEIKDFKTEQEEFLKEAVEEIKTTINTTMSEQHNEIKSMLTVAINNEAILNQIDNLKDSFQEKLDELVNIQRTAERNTDGEDLELIAESPKSNKIISEMKDEFNGFSSVISKLSGDSTEILYVLNSIRDKIDTIPESINTDSGLYYTTEEDDDENNEENKFNFIKALNLLKQDISNLKNEIKNVLPPIDEFCQKQDIETLGILENENKDLLNDLNNKIEDLSNTLSKNWLEEIKDYISGNSDLHEILNEINTKIDNLSIGDEAEWVKEIKTTLENYGSNHLEYNDKEIREMLESLNLKLDILSSDENIANQFEEIKNLIVRLNYETVEEQAKKDDGIKQLVITINEKLDIIISSSIGSSIDEIRSNINELNDNVNNSINNVNTAISKDITNVQDKLESLAIVSEAVKLDTEQISEDIKNLTDNEIKSTEHRLSQGIGQVNLKVDRLQPVTSMLEVLNEKIDVISSTDSSVNITMMLEDLNHKIDIISTNGGGTQKEIDDVKSLIKNQMEYINELGNNDDTIATFKKCLKELTDEVNNLNNHDEVQKTLKDMKDSIMAAVVKIFAQVSFVEESEDIKDFVEEKTDVINKNLVEVTKQLKQIAKSNDDEGYIYSMQDIESDLAKLRLALNEIQDNTYNSESLNETINDTLGRITKAVEKLENTMTQDELHELKYDITNLQNEVKHILITSGESYNALSSGMDAFGQIVTTQIADKVDTVTKLLQKSNDSDNVMRQALVYMGEWIDSASISMNKISSNSDDLKNSIDKLKNIIPEHTDILNTIEEKFDQQKDKLKTLEKQVNRICSVEDRIDKLEALIDKVLTLVEDMDDSRVARKIERLEKQLTKMSVNIEKLTAYVD